MVAGGLLAGCAQEPAEPAPTPTTPAPAPTTPAPEPAPTEAAWERFVDPRTPGSFEIPPGWSVVESEESEPEHELLKFDLLDSAGTKQLTYARKVMGLGGGCAGMSHTVTELETTPFEIPGYVANTGDYAPEISPSFTFTVLEDAGRPGLYGTLAVRDGLPATECFFYNMVRTEDALVSFADTLKVTAYDAPRQFATMDEARNYMATEEDATLKRVLLSLRLDG
ncbi:hypothetical protein [Leucobacter komagatae]|uniref:hypothetical protein n=1 Tax=Leucobacter komagatae TaxID=55969 RepID=UPI0012EE993E|nr:hypothetical protein [Leucobacter komagatae]